MCIYSGQRSSKFEQIRSKQVTHLQDVGYGCCYQQREAVDNMQRDKTDSKAGVPWSFLAVKTMMPVSSPTKHSAILICLPCCPPSRPLWTTILESTTLTMRLWPRVPGRSWSTLVKVGCLRAPESAAIVSVAYPGVVIEP